MTETPEEEWRDVPEFEGLYQVSDLGRVRSLNRAKGQFPRRHATIGRVLKPSVSSVGNYLIINLSRLSTTKRVHALVLLAFVGPRPDGYDIAHEDGNPHNNRLANLRYATRSENETDKRDHGTDNRGSRHGLAKLTESDVLAIDALLRDGHGMRDIAPRFGVKWYTIREINNGNNWGWLTGRTRSKPAYQPKIRSNA